MIECIYIQSHKMEIVKRLPEFLSTLSKHNLSIPVYLFLNSISLEMDISFLDTYKGLLTDIIYIDDNVEYNKVTYMFYKILKTHLKYQYILLLETDCILLDNFLVELNKDIINRCFILYGSRYYGICDWANYNTLTIDKCNVGDNWKKEACRNHINGVAVYNRTQLFQSILDEVFIRYNGLNSGANYDFLLSIFILNRYGNKGYLYDSEYILNISDKVDSKLSYKDIKSKSVIIHQKTT